MESNFITRPLDPSDSTDIYSNLKSDFGKIFHDQNLISLANPADLGFHDFSKSFPDQYPSHPEDHQKPSEPENSHNHRLHNQREDLPNYQSYSSLGLPHHNNSHYNPNHNNNYGYNNVKQQPFQQEHLGYPGYHHHHPHHQPYYHQNQHHYEGQGVQSSHSNNMDYYPQHHPREIREMGDNHHVDDSLGMMWGNGPAKAMNHRNMQMNGFYNGDLNKMKGNSGFVSYEQPSDPRNYQNMYDYDAKRNHMLRMQQEMGMSQVRKPLEVSQRGINNIMPSGVNGLDLKGQVNKGGLGAVKYAPKLSPKRNGPNGKVEFDDDDDGEDGYGDEKGRSTRGLRVLSLKVKDIVMQKKRTSYKEVAETLTHELRQKSNGKPLKEESKDEQNVKRRVYDALNVLIAAGVLRKEGKIVYCDQNNMPTHNGKKPRDDNDKLLRDLEEARKRNKAKIEVLHELIFKCLAIKNLVKTNKEKAEVEGDPDKKPKSRPSSVNATRIEVIQENPALKPKNEDVIRFPFIVLLSSSPENSMNLNMDTMQKQLAIESKKPFNIFGDIDVLLKMGLHYVSRKMFEENIPVELQKFVPKYFLAALSR